VPFLRSGRRPLAATVTGLVAAALLVGCTTGAPATPVASATTPATNPPAANRPAATPPAATPTPDPIDPPAEPVGAEPVMARPPQDVVTALGGSAAESALDASRTLFTSSPVVVLARSDDARGQLTAASAAVALRAPVLLAGSGVSVAELSTEVERLRAGRVVLVGRAPRLPGVAVVDLPPGAGRRVLSAVTGAPFGPARVVGTGHAAHVRAVAALAGSEPVPLVPEAVGDEGAVPLRRAPSVPAPPAGLVALVGSGKTPLAALASVRAAGVPVVSVPSGDPRTTSTTVEAIAALAPQRVLTLGTGFGSSAALAAQVATARTGVLLPGGGQLIFPEGNGVRGKRYVALYGTPGSKALGVLGEQSVPKTISRAIRTAGRYKSLTKDKVVPMVEIIATIASAGPGKDGNYSRERPVSELRPLVDAARKKGLAVVLDLQPGRTSFLTQAKRYSSLLALPNVGLALDPEWRLKKNQVHLKQIGSVKIAEVNKVADWLAAFTRHRHLPQKLLVLHQFSHKMIVGRSKLRTSHPELALLIHVDGQGTQPAKRATWKSLRTNAPRVHWGWKNFYDEDRPMLTPAKTFKIKPKPDLVTYQ
jgi:hypothetical protein